MKKQLKLFEHYTPVYYWNKESTKRFVVNQGGTSSSKTYSILQVLANKAIHRANSVITVVAQTANSLERGALRDFKKLLSTSSLLRFLILDPSLKQGPYIFKNGSIMEFVSLNDPETARHGKRTYLFLNEANYINYEAATHLMVRTTEQIFIDYNPDSKFWVHSEYVGKPKVDYFISTYVHNEYVDDATVEDILAYKTNWITSGDQVLFKKWTVTQNKKYFDKWVKSSSSYWKNKWYVYGCGLTGIVEGVIYENVKYINHLPFKMRRSSYFLDFGFANSETAFGRAGIFQQEIYAKELIYETDLDTPDLLKRFRTLGVSKKDLIVADPSNLDAISQIQKKGYNIVPAKKPPGSVKGGISQLRGHKLNITSDSYNWRNEQEKYKWLKVKGIWTDEPEKKHDHLWDGLRYWYQRQFGFKVRKVAHKNRDIRTFKLN